MPQRKPEPPAIENIDTGIALLLGEIRGQMRELIHSTNTTGMKIDALAARVSALEAEHNRRQGANNVLHALLRSPVLGWLVGVAVSAWAILSGKVHP
jgi:hypothetical protein